MNPRDRSSSRRLALVLALLSASSLWALATKQLPVKALDQYGAVLEGIRFAFSGVESLPTTKAGVTEISIPEMEAGESLKLDLHGSTGEIWLLIDSVVHVPSGAKEGPAEVALIRKADLVALAGSVREATGPADRGAQRVPGIITQKYTLSD